MNEERFQGQEERFQALKEKYQFAEWQGRKTLDENLFIWRFALQPDHFQGWQPVNIRSLEAPPLPEEGIRLREAAEAPVYPVRQVSSVLRAAAGSQDASINVDTYECASQAAAQDALVRILGEFQSPLVTRRDDLEAGDVAFAHPGGGLVFFARGNLVSVLRASGLRTVPVAGIARQFDLELIQKPLPTPGAALLGIQQLRLARKEAPVGEPVPIEIEAAQARAEPAMYKFFSRRGQVRLEAGQPVYEPAAPGEQELEVFAIAPGRVIAANRVSIRARAR
jgi:hypothetical protein